MGLVTSLTGAPPVPPPTALPPPPPTTLLAREVVPTNLESNELPGLETIPFCSLVGDIVLALGRLGVSSNPTTSGDIEGPTLDFREDDLGVILVASKGLIGVSSSWCMLDLGGAVADLEIGVPDLVTGVEDLSVGVGVDGLVADRLEIALAGVLALVARRGVRGVLDVLFEASEGFKGLP